MLTCHLPTHPPRPARSIILERALRRLEWERVAEKEAKAKAAKEEAEREAMLSVDWHDFAVVEAIEFFDDELDELPAPMTLKDVCWVLVSDLGYGWDGLGTRWGGSGAAGAMQSGRGFGAWLAAACSGLQLLPTAAHTNPPRN